jgi:hypothetical protein
MAIRRSTPSGRLTNDPELLAAALVGYEQQRREIIEKIEDIQRRVGGRGMRSGASTTNGALPARKRTMSAAARKRIAEAQRKRWATYRDGQEPAAAKKTAPARKARPMRRMSAAARKRIAEAQRKRWAAVRANQAAPKVKAAGI